MRVSANSSTDSSNNSMAIGAATSGADVLGGYIAQVLLYKISLSPKTVALIKDQTKYAGVRLCSSI
jgi:hypothetical protein